MAVLRFISPPAGYRWNFNMLRERTLKYPVDVLIFGAFVLHVIGYFMLLVWLRIQQRKRKLFAVSAQ